ncbi:unnamed protein product [Phaedon cochleariae]|uniref:Uncharacterized protein n=1 Tax=Phaedon cochleariae TaxID=80249 RepID=A0A9N9X2M3_PHACE|nr:unnamed protein product [Phaedon cochleariae]
MESNSIQAAKTKIAFLLPPTGTGAVPMIEDKKEKEIRKSSVSETTIMHFQLQKFEQRIEEQDMEIATQRQELTRLMIINQELTLWLENQLAHLLVAQQEPSPANYELPNTQTAEEDLMIDVAGHQGLERPRSLSETEEDISTNPPMDSPEQTAGPSQPTEKKTAKSAIPSIVLKTSSKWTLVQREFALKGVKVTSEKLTEGGVKIQTKTVEEYRSATKILEEEKHEFHTYSLPDDKPHYAVMKGIDISVKPLYIKGDLESKGSIILAVHRMKSVRTEKEIPLVLVQVPKSDARIWKVSDSCGYSVKMKIQNPPPKKVAQCHRCQQFGHGQTNWRCVKCGEPHPTSTCPKPRHTDATCANCEGKHPANFTGSPKTETANQP